MRIAFHGKAGMRNQELVGQFEGYVLSSLMKKPLARGFVTGHDFSQAEKVGKIDIRL